MERPDPTKCVACGHKLDEHARGEGMCRHTDKRRKSWKNGRCPCRKASKPSPHGTLDRPTRRGRIPKIGMVSPYQPDPDRTSLTVGDAILYLVANGLASQSAACSRCDVFETIAKQWAGRGTREIARMETVDADEPEPDEVPYVNFAFGLLEAKAERDMGGIAAMTMHHKKDWHAVVRTMQVLDRDSWDDTKQLEAPGAGGGPVKTTQVPSLDQLEAEFSMLAAQHPGVIDVQEIAS